VPTWLLIKDSEGLSVLTAWAAGKFAGDDVGMFVKKSGITDKIKHQESSFPAMPPPSWATWKRNCPAGPSPWVPGKRRTFPASSERNRYVI
jgi:hypothetical protein